MACRTGARRLFVVCRTGGDARGCRAGKCGLRTGAAAAPGGEGSGRAPSPGSGRQRRCRCSRAAAAAAGCQHRAARLAGSTRFLRTPRATTAGCCMYATDSLLCILSSLKLSEAKKETLDNLETLLTNWSTFPFCCLSDSCLRLIRQGYAFLEHHGCDYCQMHLCVFLLF